MRRHCRSRIYSQYLCANAPRRGQSPGKRQKYPIFHPENCYCGFKELTNSYHRNGKVCGEKGSERIENENENVHNNKGLACQFPISEFISHTRPNLMLTRKKKAKERIGKVSGPFPLFIPKEINSMVMVNQTKPRSFLTVYEYAHENTHFCPKRKLWRGFSHVTRLQ